MISRGYRRGGYRRLGRVHQLRVARRVLRLVVMPRMEIPIECRIVVKHSTPAIQPDWVKLLAAVREANVVRCTHSCIGANIVTSVESPWQSHRLGSAGARTVLASQTSVVRSGGRYRPRCTANCTVPRRSERSAMVRRSTTPIRPRAVFVFRRSRALREVNRRIGHAGLGTQKARQASRLAFALHEESRAPGIAPMRSRVTGAARRCGSLRTTSPGAQVQGRIAFCRTSFASCFGAGSVSR